MALETTQIDYRPSWSLLTGTLIVSVIPTIALLHPQESLLQTFPNQSLKLFFTILAGIGWIIFLLLSYLKLFRRQQITIDNNEITIPVSIWSDTMKTLTYDHISSFDIRNIWGTWALIMDYAGKQYIIWYFMLPSETAFQTILTAIESKRHHTTDMTDNGPIQQMREKFRHSLVGSWTAAVGSFNLAMDEHWEIRPDGTGTILSTGSFYYPKEKKFFIWKQTEPMVFALKVTGFMGCVDSDDDDEEIDDVFDPEAEEWYEIVYDFIPVSTDFCTIVGLIDKNRSTSDHERFYELFPLSACGVYL
ncbi:MAG: hypothetical protein R3B84_03075 [Zavarzinella sp.]